MRLHHGDFSLYLLKAAQPMKSVAPGFAYRPPLRISAARAEEVLDNLMEFQEDQQLKFFIATYLQRYDPNDDALAEFARNFVYMNLNSVFIHTDSFTAAYDCLEELFFNKELQGYFISYWAEHPRTLTGGEFLFILASLYEFERRALAYLFESYDTAKKVLDGDFRFQRAFNQKAKALVLKEVSRQLYREMGEQRIASIQDIFKRYSVEQVKIYQELTAMGGKIRDRALFAWGRAYWDEGKFGLAVQKWKEISKSFEFKTFQEIKPFLEEFGSISVPVSEGNQSLIIKINKIFEWEETESNNLLLERAMRYDKWNKRAEY
jgi:hypothetical protein